MTDRREIPRWLLERDGESGDSGASRDGSGSEPTTANIVMGGAPMTLATGPDSEQPKHPPRTEALDIEAIERTLLKALNNPWVLFEDQLPKQKMSHTKRRAIQALDRLIQALQASNDGRELLYQMREDAVAELRASNEERDRMKAALYGPEDQDTSGWPVGDLHHAPHRLLSIRRELVASNEERERVRALVGKWREEVRRYREEVAPDWNASTVRLHDADELEAAIEGDK